MTEQLQLKSPTHITIMPPKETVTSSTLSDLGGNSLVGPGKGRHLMPAERQQWVLWQAPAVFKFDLGLGFCFVHSVGCTLL